MDEIIDMTEMKLTIIPNLRNSGLIDIDLSRNNILQIIALALPIKLLRINISHNGASFNMLDSSNFPSTIEEIIMDSTKVNFFDGSCFPNLKKLSLCNCDMTQFIFPPNIEELEIAKNQMEVLEDLPRTLRTLNCSNNLLYALPLLNIGLEGLDCSNNKLREIPNFPYTLTHLDVSNNYLDAIIYLPPLLMDLNADSNLLEDISGLPEHLVNLSVNHNYLSQIPTLPKTIKMLSIKHNYLWEIRNEDIPYDIEYINICDNKFLKNIPDLLINRKSFGVKLLYGESSAIHNTTQYTNIYDDTIYDTEYLFTNDTNYGPEFNATTYIPYKDTTIDDPLCVSVYNTTTICV